MQQLAEVSGTPVPAYSPQAGCFCAVRKFGCMSCKQDGILRRYGLARLHPLLAHAMRLREANSVTAMVTPLAMHFPVETLTIKVSPLKLQIKGNKLMRGAMRLLENRYPSLLGAHPYRSLIEVARTCAGDAELRSESGVLSHRSLPLL